MGAGPGKKGEKRRKTGLRTKFPLPLPPDGYNSHDAEVQVFLEALD